MTPIEGVALVVNGAVKEAAKEVAKEAAKIVYKEAARAACFENPIHPGLEKALEDISILDERDKMIPPEYRHPRIPEEDPFPPYEKIPRIPPELRSTFERLSPSMKKYEVEMLKRPLKEKEVKEVCEKTGMKRSVLEGAMIDENGKIYLRSENQALEGKIHEKTGVPYVRKEIEIKGVKIEVVVPDFNDVSVFETILSEGAIESGMESSHLLECIEKLKEELAKNPDLRAKFTENELKMIYESTDGRIKGYTWHHDAEYGRMQLVPTGIHSRSGHLGGMSIWGGGYK